MSDSKLNLDNFSNSTDFCYSLKSRISLWCQARWRH